MHYSPLAACGSYGAKEKKKSVRMLEDQRVFEVLELAEQPSYVACSAFGGLGGIRSKMGRDQTNV